MAMTDLAPFKNYVFKKSRIYTNIL